MSRHKQAEPKREPVIDHRTPQRRKADELDEAERTLLAWLRDFQRDGRDYEARLAEQELQRLRDMRERRGLDTGLSPQDRGDGVPFPGLESPAGGTWG